MGCNDWLRLKALVLNLPPPHPFSCPPTLSTGLSFTDHNDLPLPQAQNDSCSHSLPPKKENQVISLQNTTSMEKRYPSGGLLHVHETTS